MLATYNPLKPLVNKTDLQRLLKFSKGYIHHRSIGSPFHKIGATTENIKALADARWVTF